MKNVQICPNCNAENPIYQYSCSSCKAFLRTRVVNIDLWETISRLIESPVKTFHKIIEAEHKNFVIFLNSLTGIKLFLLAVIITSFNHLNSFNDNYFFLNLLLVFGASFVSFFLISSGLTFFHKVSGLKNRFKDNYAILNYAFVPLLMSLLILSPVHYALFGEYWFTYNPPPYVVKPTEAYILLFIEGLMMIWSYLLLIFGLYAETRSKIYSIISSSIIFVMIGILLYYFPFLPY